jgi:hypothetical protein
MLPAPQSAWSKIDAENNASTAQGAGSATIMNFNRN